MSENKSTQWKSVIYNYIDSITNDKNIDELKHYSKIRLYIEAINTVSSSNNILTEKDKKILISINKKPLTFQNYTKTSDEKKEKHILNFKDAYNYFLEKEWINSIEDKIEYVESLYDFHKLWIFYALTQMQGISQATHIPKLTHSSNKGTALVDSIKEKRQGLLTTSSLTSPIYDGAYPDAKLSPIAKFLLLSLDEDILGELLKHGDEIALKEILEKHEIDNWMKAFYKYLNPRIKADHLSKQVYFPVNDDYHLLIVLKSSSLIQAIYDTYFFKDVRKARDKIYKQKEKEKYSPEVYQSLPNVATLATVMSQPQNVSVNNGSRGGNIRLFNSAPPVWQNQLKPPLHLKTMFNARLLNRYAFDNIKQLRDLLLTFEKAEISFKDPNRLKGVRNWVKAIANNVIDYSQTLAILPAGWSANPECQLPIEQQIFLDFDRQDAEFNNVKRQSDWQGKLVKGFVFWLNKSLTGKDNKFISTNEHNRIWRDVFSDILRDHIDMLKMTYDEQSVNLDSVIDSHTADNTDNPKETTV